MTSVKSLAGVFGLAVFILIVLSVCTLCLYMGSLRQKCIKWPVSGNLSSDWSDSNSLSDYNNTFDFHQHVNDPGMITMVKSSG